MKRIILVSGGVDSFAAYKCYTQELIDYEWENIPVFIDYKGMYTHKEKEVVRELYGDSLYIIEDLFDFSKFENQSSAYIPNRNVLLALGVLFHFPEADEIIMAGLKDDNVSDKTKEAFAKITAMLNETHSKTVKVVSPFWETNKSEVVSFLLERGVDKEELFKTCSCYHSSNEKWCGECRSCFRRFCAFFDNDIIDPKMPFFKNELLMKFYEKNFIKYDKQRQKSISKAILYSREKIAELFDNYSVDKDTYFNKKAPAGAKVSAFDIDGTLTYETEGFNPVAYATRTPKKSMVNLLKTHYEEGREIVLFTSRKPLDVEVTCEWLIEHQIPFHSIVFNKLQYDVFYDDKAISGDSFV